MADRINGYIEELRQNLTRKCGKRKVASILAEVQSHLDEGIEELVATGMARSEAEQTVLIKFGEAADVSKWYAEKHGKPNIWKASLWPLAAIVTTDVFWTYQNDLLPGSYNNIRFSLIVLNLLLVSTIILCARSKRFVSGVIVLATCFIFVGNVVYDCIWAVPVKYEHGYGVVAKRDIPAEMSRNRSLMQRDTWLLGIYSQGQKAFASETESATGVGQFRDSRGYLSQTYFMLLDPRHHATIEGKPFNGIVPTYNEARDFWLRQPRVYCAVTGQQELFYKADALNEIAECKNLLATLPHADAIPLAKKAALSLDAAHWLAMFTLIFGIFADLTGGLLRLTADLVKRRKTPGPITS